MVNTLPFEELSQNLTIILTHSFPIHPFSTYPLKTSGNLKFSDVFRGYRKGGLGTNKLKY